MMTLRIEPDLLASLKHQAKAEGRSLSAQVVYLIEGKAAQPVRQGLRARRSTEGMFADFEAPALEQLRTARGQLSAMVLKSGRRRPSK